MTGGRVTVGYDFFGLVRGAYKANPIVFACIDRRQALFSEARFQYRQFKKGRPGDLFGGPGLTILEHPWPGGTTGDLLALAEVHNSCSGNFFCARRGDRLAPLRPDWVSVIIGSNTEADDPADVWDIDAEVLGYLYTEGGPGSGRDPIYLMPEEVAHYMPRPDPEAPWRGMSWVTALLREVAADREMTDHKSKYLDAGATPNLAVKLDVTDAAKFQEWVDKYRSGREGDRGNPYKTLFLSSVATPIPLGSDMQGIDFRRVQGAGEVRIAVAAGVPPAVLAISEGLQGSALNAGNFQASQRQFADATMRPLWRNFAGSMARIVAVPDGAELWYDDRDIPALQQDADQAATILNTQAATMASLIINGFEPDSVVDAVTAGDLKRLVHSGLVSVQLLPKDGSGNQPPSNSNGNGNGGSGFGANGNGSGTHTALIAPPGVTFADGAIKVAAAPQPNVDVVVQPPNVQVDIHPGGVSRRTVTFSDGRTATIEEESDQ
jgi:hypothetical protein